MTSRTAWPLYGLMAFSLAACKTPAGNTAKVANADAPAVAGPTVKAGPIATPLKTCGRWIIDNNGKRFKFAAANWYGASDATNVVGGLNLVTMASVASTIVSLGFNSVRLPFSNDMLHVDTPVDPKQVAANPNLVGLTPLEVYDKTIETLTSAGLAVIIDNHQTHPGWCCSLTDNNGMWYTFDFSYNQWISDWKMMAARYANNPLVVAAELRNEVRAEPQSQFIKIPIAPLWDIPGPINWPSAATDAGNQVSAINSKLLIVVDGINFADDLTGASLFPIRLNNANHLVYAAHNYGYFSPALGSPTYGAMSDDQFKQKVGQHWGFLLNQNQRYTAPVFITEFGDSPFGNKAWLNRIVAYLDSADIDWAWWPINASPSATGRSEDYSLLQPDWKTPKDDFRIPLIQSIETPTQGPGVGTGPDNSCPGS